MAKQARSILGQLSGEDFPRLSLHRKSLHTMPDLAAAVDQAVDEDGAVRDEASPALARLRREVVRLTAQIKDSLQSIINSPTLSKALQEPIYTQRNGRYVLPVNAGMRRSIEGIVQDSSASGLTVYVEPLAVVELSNKIRLIEADIEREIDRVLRELTERTGLYLDPLTETFEALVELDFIAARAALAAKYEGVLPELSPVGRLRLLGARHPLLILQDPTGASSVVPNDITLSPELRTLVITGPNTGGKTVYLKTAGLLSLMIRAGLLIPVRPGSSAVIFPEVFADIGDEQSLEQSLSTFSSHMRNIVEVVERAEASTLVLLDEIGAGTDPKEGSALARAILLHLNGRGAYTIATTHFGELKELAYTTPGFLNASLDFDEETLSPTYRLRPGVPGSSQATTIASRLGLRRDVVDRAVSFLESGEADSARTIAQLEEKLRALCEQEEELARRIESAAAAEQEALRQIDEAQAERLSLKQEFAAELESQYRQARQTIRSLIAELQKAPNMVAAQKAREKVEEIRRELGWRSITGSDVLTDVTPGQTVRIKSLNQKGVVESLPEKTESGKDPLVAVRAGRMRVKVPLSDLAAEPDVGAPKGQPRGPDGRPGSLGAPASSRRQQGDRSRTSRRDGGAHRQGSPGPVQSRERSGPDVFVRTSDNTLDLRGHRVDDGLQLLERFIDESCAAGTTPVMIIHGHGTGAMKAAVRQYLAGSDYRITSRPGELYEGGDGVTVVSFQ